jgi:ABC-2 type transport system ATP-binding protein
VLDQPTELPSSPAESAEILVDVKDVSRSYGDIRAVKNLSFSVCKGEVLGFLGPNGAGKTTTMQIISGNLAADEGSITIAGHDLLQQPKAAKAALGYLPEQPPLYRELTVNEYLDYCAALNRIARKQRKEARERAKERTGLLDVGKRLIANLSKGFQQRVALAQAIIHSPPLMILDEPTIGLDPIQIRETRGLIRELGKDHGVILSTHILPEVQASCDRVQIISNGSLVLNDTIDGLAKHMRSLSLAVAFRRPPAPSQLEQLAGVTAVQSDGGERLQILHRPDSDPTEEIVRLATQHDWGLYEIQPLGVSLEELFVELTTEGSRA